MQQKQQQFSIWYFILTFLILIAVQRYLPTYRSEMITYSQFKSLVRQGFVADLIISETNIHGNIKPEGMKEIFPAEKLKDLKYDGKTPYPFTTIRVNDPDLTAGLERAGISFKGELTSNWLPTILSWVVPIALFFVVWGYLMKRMGGGPSGVMQIGKSKARPRKMPLGVRCDLDPFVPELGVHAVELPAPQKRGRIR